MTTASLRLSGTVSDICRPGPYPDQVERVTVSVDGAEPLYAELRLPNTLRWSLGQKVVVVIVALSPEHELVRRPDRA